jgi:DNA-binding transcriptional LysR family regulator
MDLMQLEHFLAVADERTFTRAAERVFRTQPALSQSIKKLEKSVGAPLFARDLNGVSLTEAGKFLVEYARKMVTMRDEATRSISRLQALKAGTLSLAANESAELYLLPGPLKHFIQLFPEVKVRIQRGSLDEIPRKVLDREVQIGFVRDTSAFQELHSVEVYTDEMAVIASPDNPITLKKPASIQDLDGISLIVHRFCNWTEDTVLRLFRQHSLDYRVAVEVPSIESIKNLVLSDVGIAVVPRIAVLQELRQRRLVQIFIPEFAQTLRSVMIFRRDNESELGRQLIEIMRNKLFVPRLKDRIEDDKQMREA